MTDDDVVYEWALSELTKPLPAYAEIRQLVSLARHSDAEREHIVAEFRRLYLHDHKSQVLFDKQGRWSKAECSRSKLGRVLMHPSRTSFPGCPDPPTLARFVDVPQAVDLELKETKFDPLEVRGRLIFVGSGDGQWRLADGCHRAYMLWTKGSPPKLKVVLGVHPIAEAWRKRWEGSV